jgi:hypothetical protein
MQRAVLLTLLLGAIACDADKPPAPPRPAAASSSEPAPAAAVDRSKDPAFALKQDGDRYLGLVVERCPEGARSAPAPAVAPAIVDGELRLELPFGGCPTWTQYSVVVGKGSPLPFHACVDVDADKCQLAGTKVWSFDIAAALRANGATAVAYSVPAGVR